MTSIGAIAFEGNKYLKSIEIPNGVTCLDYCVLSDCDSLSSILIPNSVKEICMHL